MNRPWLKHYDPWVRPYLTYPPHPLHDILSAAASRFPDRHATMFLGKTMTYREVKEGSDRFAGALARLGIGKGDRVGITLPNCPQYVIGAFAILRLGAAIVNINPGWTPRDAQNVAADAGLRTTITLETFTDLLDEGSADQPPPVSIRPDDLAVLQYTVGGTSTPIGAMLTHANIFANVIQTEAFMYGSQPTDERYLLVLPFFNMYAFTAGMMRGTWIGALQILLPKYDPGNVLSAIYDFEPTHFPAVPAIYASLLKHSRARESRLDRVRTYNAGGDAPPKDLMARWEALTTRPLNQGYGLSQTSPVITMTPQLARRRPGTVGLPLPDTDIKIVDLETGLRESPSGEPGELCVAGPQVMAGYWNRPDETSRALRRDDEGRVWFHTGDLAQIDQDGFTTILERNTPCGD